MNTTACKRLFALGCVCHIDAPMHCSNYQEMEPEFDRSDHAIKILVEP